MEPKVKYIAEVECLCCGRPIILLLPREDWLCPDCEDLPNAILLVNFGYDWRRYN